MNDNGRVVLAMASGALVGGVVGYLYLTAGGRRMRDQFEPRLDDALREIRKLGQTINKAQAVAAEGWRSLSAITGQESRAEWGAPRQSSPY